MTIIDPFSADGRESTEQPRTSMRQREDHTALSAQHAHHAGERLLRATGAEQRAVPGWRDQWSFDCGRGHELRRLRSTHGKPFSVVTMTAGMSCFVGYLIFSRPHADRSLYQCCKRCHVGASM